MENWTNIFSGKFLFTIITAAVFAYATYTKMLTNEQIHGIIMLVVIAYFNKPSTNGGSNGSTSS